jgi:preprotein translocase subunit SecF
MNYRLLLIVPMAILLLSIGILANNYIQTGEWFERDIELKGGTLITLETENPMNIMELESRLSGIAGPVDIRELKGLSGYQLMIAVEAGADYEAVLDEVASLGIDTERFSVRTIGPALGRAFWSQAQTGIIIAFIFMGIIVFVIFRTFVPSFAVILAAVSDIVVTLALMQVFGISLSLASFASLLMLIGYSVDTDILLTTRLIRESGPLREKIRGALKTGLTMSLTTIGALSALLISGISPVLSQIAMVLLIGISIDIINTWLQNSVILRWYAEKKGID